MDTCVKLVSEDPELRAFSHCRAANFDKLGLFGSIKLSSSGGGNPINGVALIVGIALAVLGGLGIVYSFLIMKQKQVPVMVDNADNASVNS